MPLRHRLLSFLVSALVIAGCTAGGLIPADAAIDAPPAPDAGPPPPDTGPPVDAGPRLDDVLIYAHSRDTLFTFSPYTNTVTTVGPFMLSGAAITNDDYMLDLAVDSSGVVLTASGRALFRVNPETAELTEIGTFDFSGSEQLFALSFLTPSESPDGTEMLIGATNEGVYYEVDRVDATTSMLGAYPDMWSSSGDIVSIDGLGTFATLRRADFPSDVLARILFARDGSSVVTVIGPIRDASTDFTQIFGLGYWGRNVYGFDNSGRLLQIDRETGAATVVSADTGTLHFWGAGVTTRAPVLI